MDTHSARHLPLAGTYNVRDLGGYAAGSGRVQWRQFLRADSLHRLDAQGVARLLEEGVRTVVDLRQPAELEAQPNPFREHSAVRYHNISLFDRIRPPTDAADVLLEMYKLALAERGEALRTIMTTIAQAGEGAVLFHCTAGKDRTGIVAALLLSIGGVEAADIESDYAQTASLIAPMIEELIEGARVRGANPEEFRPMLASSAHTMAAFLVHLDEAHGGTEAYLASIGVGPDVQARLRQRLVGGAA